MKTNKIDLNIDFLGGLGSLTKMEEKELSDFFKSRKLAIKTSNQQTINKIIRPKAIAK